MDWESISRHLAGLLRSEIRSSSRKAFLENSLIDEKRDAEKKKSGCVNEVTPFVSSVVLVSLHFALETALLHGDYFRARAILMTVFEIGDWIQRCSKFLV